MPEYGNPWPVPATHNGEGMNMAQWVGTFEDWAEKMMGMGYKVDDLPGIAAQAGETFPRNLIASIKAKNALFPGADMLYEYDMTGHEKRRPWDSHDFSKGYMPWEQMDPSEIAAANSYHSWANNPSNAGYESSFGDNNYNAYLAATHGNHAARPGSTGYGGSYGGPFNWTPPSASQALSSQGVNGDTLGGILSGMGMGQQAQAPGIETYGGPDPYEQAGIGTLGSLVPGTEDWRKKRNEQPF
jgi:hypothetical protein